MIASKYFDNIYCWMDGHSHTSFTMGVAPHDPAYVRNAWQKLKEHEGVFQTFRVNQDQNASVPPPPSPISSFNFFGLTTEIRLQIYKELLVSPEPISFDFSGVPSWRPVLVKEIRPVSGTSMH